MRCSLLVIAGLFFNVSAWAEPARSAFQAPDVATALREVFGRSGYVASDRIKIQDGLPGDTRDLAANRYGGDDGSVTVSVDFPGPRKIALLMEPMRARPDAPPPLLAIYHLSDRSNAIVVPVRFPYTDVRITAVAEAAGKLWGAQEVFYVRRASDPTERGGPGPCDDRPREALARFTGPALDNMARISYSAKTGVALIGVSVQHDMTWEPVLDIRNCTLAAPRAIRSAQLEYGGALVAEVEWGPGIARPTMRLAMPSARVGAPLTLRWQDTRGRRYAFSGTVPVAFQNGATPLHSASMNGDVATVRRLLAAGEDVNATLPNGWTPLGFAVVQNRSEVVQVLLDHGADPNVRFQYGDTALMWAAYTRQPALVTALLAHGAEGTARDEFGNNLFALAIHGARGAWVRTQARANLLPIVQTLIARGLVDHSDATLAAFQVAAEQDDYAVIKALIESGFDPTVNVGDTPLLIWAVKHGYVDLVGQMLADGAPVNIESKQCETPLIVAASRGFEYRLELNRKAMVELLLRHGAKPLAKNKRGVDAFKAAESLKMYQKGEIVDLLSKAAGGDGS
jgi:ankyrin repeat protein